MFQTWKVTQNFCSVLSFLYLRRFGFMYIYANCNEVCDRELVVGFSVEAADLARFSA